MDKTYADGIAEGFKRGYAQGCRDGFWKATLRWIKHERLRHLQDVANADSDIAKLESRGVRIAVEPTGKDWFSVEDDPLEL